MAIPLMMAAAALSELVPTISKWLSNSEDSMSTTHKITQQVVDVARRITKCEDPMSAVQLLSQDPKLLIEYQQILAHMEHKIERALLYDRMQARDRDTAIMAAGRSNTRADIMVISAALGLILCLVALAYYQGHLPGEAVGIISTIAGIFGSCLKDAYAFEFGSSRGSKTKDLVALLNYKSNQTS